MLLTCNFNSSISLQGQSKNGSLTKKLIFMSSEEKREKVISSFIFNPLSSLAILLKIFSTIFSALRLAVFRGGYIITICTFFRKL